MNRNQMFDRLCAYSHELSEMNYADELPTQVYVDKCRAFGYSVAESPYDDMEFILAFRIFVSDFADLIKRAEGALK